MSSEHDEVMNQLGNFFTVQNADTVVTAKFIVSFVPKSFSQQQLVKLLKEHLGWNIVIIDEIGNKSRFSSQDTTAFVVGASCTPRKRTLRINGGMIGIQNQTERRPAQDADWAKSLQGSKASSSASPGGEVEMAVAEEPTGGWLGGTRIKLGDNSPRAAARKGLRGSPSPSRATIRTEYLKRSVPGITEPPKTAAPRSPRLLMPPGGPAPAPDPSAGSQGASEVSAKVRVLEDRIARIEGTLTVTNNKVNDLANTSVLVKEALERNSKQSEEVAALLKALKSSQGEAAPTAMEQG